MFLHDVHDCGDRYRQNPVLTADLARSFSKCRNENALNTEIVEAESKRDYIDYRIDRADFVEVDFFKRDTVHFGFGFGNYFENFSGQIFGVFTQFCVFDYMQDVT